MHAESFYLEYQLLHEEYQLNSNSERGGSSNLHKMNESLNNHFILNRFKQACKALLSKNISNSEYPIDFLDDILKYLDKQEIVSHTLIDIYYKIYQLYISDEYVYFQALQTIINQHKKQIHIKELRDIHALMINYIIKKMNMGHRELVNVLLDLYKMGLEDLILIENNFLSHFTYINIAAAALIAKNNDWCKEFIEKYKKNIQGNFREDYYLFNLSKYYFAIKDFKQAAQLMNKLDIEDILTNLNAKSTLIKAYIELEDYVFADYQIDRLKQYLWRKKLSTYHKTNYQNFIKFAKAILDIDRKKIKKLKGEIEQQKILTEKEWFLEKIK